VAQGDGPKDHDHKAHDHGGHDHKGDREAGAGHLHAPVPFEYRSAHVPSAAWTDPRMIARGREIYASRCAVCHGEDGRGDGPAAAALPLKPPDLRDPGMVGEMAGNYWFWRISEGGLVEPFRSQGSIMPAWKDELSVEDRWAVIAYQHTFSGHRGPHVTSEHPQMVSAGHASHGAPAAPAGGAPAGGRPAEGAPGGVAPAPGGAHKH
jgi:mono/diheme cytochrome c family protein